MAGSAVERIKAGRGLLLPTHGPLGVH